MEHPRDFSNPGGLRNDNDGDFASEGLLTIDGDKHRQQRRAVQPAFHKKQVEGYASIINQYTQELLKTWYPGDRLDMSRAMQELTLRIVSKCLFSIDLSSQLGPLSDAFDGVIGSSTSMAEDLLNIRIDNPVTGYGKRMAATRQLDMLIYTLIAQRRDDDRDYNDVLSMLMSVQSGEEPDTKLTEKQIHDHILTFLAAGHETTAITLVWTFTCFPSIRRFVSNCRMSFAPCWLVESQPPMTFPDFLSSIGFWTNRCAFILRHGCRCVLSLKSLKLMG